MRFGRDCWNDIIKIASCLKEQKVHLCDMEANVAVFLHSFENAIVLGHDPLQCLVELRVRVLGYEVASV